MGFDLIWEDEDIEKAGGIYNSRVGSELENVLQNKNDELQWKNDMTYVANRFHNTFSLGELHMAEAAFNVDGKEFRGLCIILEDLQKIIYFDIADKNNQKRKLRQIEEKSQEIKSVIRQQVSQSSS